MRIADILAEKIAYKDHNFVVILNPTKREVEQLARKADHGEGLRAILALGDLYVWDGYWANHDEIGRKLGLSEDACLHLWDSYVELDADMIDSDDELHEKAAMIKVNATIRRVYGNDVNIKAELDDRDVWL